MVILDELQQLFDLRDRRATAIDKFILADAELQGYMQQNAQREFVEVHDLDIAHRLLQPVLTAKQELETCNQQFEQKKQFFISLLEASGCSKLHCSNKEFNSEGEFEYVPYVVSISKNLEGKVDLNIHAAGSGKV